MTFDYDLNQFTNTYSNSRRHQALGNGQEVPYVGSGIYGGSQELATVKGHNGQLIPHFVFSIFNFFYDSWCQNFISSASLFSLS